MFLTPSSVIWSVSDLCVWCVSVDERVKRLEHRKALVLACVREQSSARHHTPHTRADTHPLSVCLLHSLLCSCLLVRSYYSPVLTRFTQKHLLPPTFRLFFLPSKAPSSDPLSFPTPYFTFLTSPPSPPYPLPCYSPTLLSTDHPSSLELFCCPRRFSTLQQRFTAP